MTLDDAEDLFRSEVSRLLPVNPFLEFWSYGLSRRGTYRQLGCCYYRKKLIRMNPEYIEKGRFEDVLDTIRHELAHAISVERHGERQGGGHGGLWKVVCLEVGAVPKSCKSDIGFEFDTIIRKNVWVLRHMETGEVFRRFQVHPGNIDLRQVRIPGRPETIGMLEIAHSNAPLIPVVRSARAACVAQPTSAREPDRGFVFKNPLNPRRSRGFC
jgi:hypothetical protein